MVISSWISSWSIYRIYQWISSAVGQVNPQFAPQGVSYGSDVRNNNYPVGGHGYNSKDASYSSYNQQEFNQNNPQGYIPSNAQGYDSNNISNQGNYIPQPQPQTNMPQPQMNMPQPQMNVPQPQVNVPSQQAGYAQQPNYPPQSGYEQQQPNQFLNDIISNK